MRLLHTVANVDRRVLYVIVTIALALPLVKPIGLPLPISKETQDLYDTIEALSPGSVVWVDFANEPGTVAESLPQAYAVVSHLFARNMKVIFFACKPDATKYVAQVSQALAKEFSKVYGKDYVDLGYRPELNSVLNSMARDFSSVFTVDAYGKPLESLELTASIKNIDSIDLFFILQTGEPGLTNYINQIQQQFGKPLITAMTAVNGPTYYPYYKSGQIKGMLVGLKGAAEYEKLVGRPGAALAGMDAQSLVHLLLVFFIIVGNIHFFTTRPRKEAH